MNVNVEIPTDNTIADTDYADADPVSDKCEYRLCYS